MLKACYYCGRIHDDKIPCRNKQEAEEKRLAYKNGHRGRSKAADSFRNTNRWRQKRNEIFHRDRCLCLCCLAELEGTETKYNTEALEVHHIVPLREDIEKKDDNENLITVCKLHHEMCEGGDIGRDIQRHLARWSEQGIIDMKEQLIKENLTV